MNYLKSPKYGAILQISTSSTDAEVVHATADNGFTKILSYKKLIIKGRLTNQCMATDFSDHRCNYTIKLINMDLKLLFKNYINY